MQTGAVLESFILLFKGTFLNEIDGDTNEYKRSRNSTGLEISNISKWGVLAYFSTLYIFEIFEVHTNKKKDGTNGYKPSLMPIKKNYFVWVECQVYISTIQSSSNRSVR